MERVLDSKNSLVRSVDRAFDILECFTKEENELTLGEISSKIDLPKATASRLLSTLSARGYIFLTENNTYKLGMKIFSLSSVVTSTINVRDVAYPIMKKLAEETGETVDLNIIDGYERVCVEKIESEHQLRNFIKLGGRNTLIYGASGKLLLSYQNEDYVKETLKYYNVDDEKFARNLLTDIEKIRVQKYAFTIGERISQGFAMAAPIIDYQNKVETCITISGPVFRLTGKELDFIDKVKKAGEEISNRLSVKKSK
jgi:IclR family KDG regulon transcriptional repressor